MSFVDTAIRYCYFTNLIESARAVSSSFGLIIRNATQFSSSVSVIGKYSSISSQLRFGEVAFLFLVFDMSVCEAFE